MTEDHIRYDILVQDALRGVTRKVLAEVAKAGLPGDHHFYITFATRAPGVRISSRLLNQYPDDMTIVLQHQFWDLAVTDHAFEVGLSFNGIPERLLVPFSAIKAFTDPSVKFMWSEPPAAGPVEVAGPSEKEEPAAVAPAEAAAAPLPATPLPAKARKQKTPPETEAEKPAGEAEVVSLDAFRKKS